MDYPKTHKESLIFRAKLLAKCGADSMFQAKVKELFFRDILFAFNVFFYTLDVRKRPEHHRCFCTYGYQDETIIDLYNAIQGQEDIVVEKSRDMGCSWMVILVYLYCWLDPRGGGDFLLGSRIIDYVDKKGDMRTLFEKVRYGLYKLPVWLRPKGFIMRKHDYYARLINPETGATITGESNNPNFSTGGRYTSALFDEFAKWENTDASAWMAAGDATPCRIAVSTANGASGQYYQLVTDGKTKKVVLHWSRHPEKGEGLYCAYPKPLEAGDIVDEHNWMGLRGVWYDKQCERRNDLEVAQELDINYIGAGYPYFTGRAMSRLQVLLKATKEPKKLLGLEYGSFELAETDQKDDALFVYEPPDKDCQYIVAVDVAEGKEGGDYSVVKVLNRFTLSTDASFYTHVDEVQLSRYVVAITKYYTFDGQEEPWWAVETNSLGLAVFDLCNEIYDLPNPFMMPKFDTVKQSASYRKGWWTATESRRVLTSGIMRWLLDGTGWTDNRCVGEMLTFVKDKNGKPAAKEGTHDDEVLCFGIGLQVHSIVPFENEEEISLADLVKRRNAFSGTVTDKQGFAKRDTPTVEETCIATAINNQNVQDDLMKSEELIDIYTDY